MVGLTDGLGGEEVNQDVNVQTSVVANTDGVINSDNTQGGFGARIEVGSSLTGTTGFGSAVFQSNFANTQYYFAATAGSNGTSLGVNAGSTVAMIDGVAGRNVSGVDFAGNASTPYYWVAIGL